MELENKSSAGAGGGIESGVEEREAAEVADKRNMRVCDVILRFSAMALSLAATAALGVNKETATAPETLTPPAPMTTSKWHYIFAFVLFVVANVVACCHAIISMLVRFANMDGEKWIIFLDLGMVALLFYAVGAAFTIGLMGFNLQLDKVCNVFDEFCNRTTVAVGLSGTAALAFFFLVVLATLNLHNKH